MSLITFGYQTQSSSIHGLSLKKFDRVWLKFHSISYAGINKEPVSICNLLVSISYLVIHRALWPALGLQQRLGNKEKFKLLIGCPVMALHCLWQKSCSKKFQILRVSWQPAAGQTIWGLLVWDWHGTLYDQCTEGRLQSAKSWPQTVVYRWVLYKAGTGTELPWTLYLPLERFN